jgi:cytoskeleton protein RodZ
MAHLGERLRQQRLAKGVSLQQISGQTRISLRYLEALEAGDFKQLPGAIFARSFVRQYAEIVGTEVSSLESELQQIFPSEETFTPDQLPSSTLRANLQSDTLLAANGPVWKRLPLTAISLATALAISSLLYVGWQRVVLHNETSAPPPPPPPVKPLVSQSTTPPGQQSSTSSPTVRPTAVSTPDAPAARATKPGAEMQAPSMTGGPAMSVRVVASEQTWVSFSANGRLLFSAILQPHEERVVNGVEYARMVVGNSTGVDVLTDGQSIGPIGPQGSVRVIVLAPGNPPQISKQKDFPSARPRQPSDPEGDGNGAGSSPTKLD